MPLSRVEASADGNVLVESIEEEQLSFGLGDEFEIIGPTGGAVMGTVRAVYNTKCIAASLESDSLPKVGQARFVAKKVT